ncbi:hypothetical protein QQ045_019580 [Rhodiola kirilowii]
MEAPVKNRMAEGSKDLLQDDQDLVYNSVQRKVATKMAGKLCEPVTELEIQSAVFQMAPTKAPGSDGFHALFYQKFWHIIKDKVIDTVLRVFDNGKLEEGMNETLNRHPKKVEEFRPISPCNVSAKIVMKILANRLKAILPLIISETQSAFVPGRLISDNILFAHEVLHYIKNRRNQRTCFFSIKTDMTKAYDQMEWSFLTQMLNKLGFPDRWTKIIMECISSVSQRSRKAHEIPGLTDSFQPQLSGAFQVHSREHLEKSHRVERVAAINYWERNIGEVYSSCSVPAWARTAHWRGEVYGELETGLGSGFPGIRIGAVQFGRENRMGLSHCIFETDCTKAYALSTLRSHSPNFLPVLVREILNFMLAKNFWSLSLIRREANCIADNLARLAREKAWRWSLAEALLRLRGFLP